MRLILIVSFLLLAADVLADPKQDAMVKSIQGTERLLYDSVSAKKIIEGNNQEAKRIRDEAVAYLNQAKKANQEGDGEKAKNLLQQAKRTFFGAIRLVGNGVVRNGKKQKFKKFYSSSQALLDALKQVSVEKKASEASAKVIQTAQESMQNAQQLMKSGKLTEAVDVIEKTYLSLKLSISRLREGDTLVRELNFATKEEEYQYELGRNKTHRVLLDILLKDKLKNPKYSILMRKPLDKANQLQQQAESLAANGDFEEAVKVLEQSTKQIVRAIRAAGIYIPG